MKRLDKCDQSLAQLFLLRMRVAHKFGRKIYQILYFFIIALCLGSFLEIGAF